jgi:hypothetical protein
MQTVLVQYDMMISEFAQMTILFCGILVVQAFELFTVIDKDQCSNLQHFQQCVCV